MTLYLPIVQVSGLVGRADILAGLFCLAAMLTYFPPPSGWGANVVVTMVMCLASALSKELGVASFVLSPLFLCLIRKKVRGHMGVVNTKWCVVVICVVGDCSEGHVPVVREAWSGAS